MAPTTTTLILFLLVALVDFSTIRIQGKVQRRIGLLLSVPMLNKDVFNKVVEVKLATYLISAFVLMTILWFLGQIDLSFGVTLVLALIVINSSTYRFLLRKYG